jgi:bifunctional DNA-binding transcriptional regulator/antitoxin component of YhaV-PrlF toxin-antitoxin module
MLYIINSGKGKFEIPEDIREKFNIAEDDDSLAVRINAGLIEWVLSEENETGLMVVDIPEGENVTDWGVWSFDGMEAAIAVVDGKITSLQEVKKNV